MTLRRGELRLSDLISAVLNPSVATGAFFCILAARVEPPGAGRIVHDAIGVAFTAVVPVALLFLLRSLGRLSDLEMRVRPERSLDFTLCTIGYAAGTGLLLLTEAPWQLWGLMALHLPNTLILLAVNRRFKVSIHTMVFTSLAAAALIFLKGRWALAGLVVPAAAWARWDAGNHTVSEILWGILLGGLLTPAEIFVLHKAFGGG